MRYEEDPRKTDSEQQEEDESFVVESSPELQCL